MCKVVSEGRVPGAGLRLLERLQPQSVFLHRLNRLVFHSVICLQLVDFCLQFSQFLAVLRVETVNLVFFVLQFFFESAQLFSLAGTR